MSLKGKFTPAPWVASQGALPPGPPKGGVAAPESLHLGGLAVPQTLGPSEAAGIQCIQHIQCIQFYAVYTVHTSYIMYTVYTARTVYTMKVSYLRR